MNVTQLLDFGVAIFGDRLKTALAETFKRGLELREAFQRRAGTHMFIMVQHHFAYPILDRHNRALEAAFFPAFGGAALALHCNFVDILPGVAAERRSGEHPSELQSLMRISMAASYLTQKKHNT